MQEKEQEKIVRMLAAVPTNTDQDLDQISGKQLD